MKEIKNNGTVACPKCGEGAEMHSTSANMFICMVVSLLCFGVSVWIPVLGWICAPIFIIMAIVFFIAAIIGLFTGGAKIECKNCNSKYKLTKEERKEYTSRRDEVDENWNNAKNTNYLYINKIEKLEQELERVTNEEEAEKIRKKIERLEKNI